MTKAVGGRIAVKYNGKMLRAKGSWTYNLGEDRREAVTGPDGTHGFKAMPQVPFIEGEITDTADMNLTELLRVTDATVTLELANGKVISLKEAWYASEGTGNTEEGNVGCRFEGMSAEEIR